MSIDAPHNPGGQRTFRMMPGMRGDALISKCGCYRTFLWREWGTDTDTRPTSALWIGMNPSTATGDLDDPTIQKEIRFTMRLGHHRYVKTNVLDYRITNPKGLLGAGITPRSPENLSMIRWAAATASTIVLAY